MTDVLSHDRVLEAYLGDLGSKFIEQTRARIDWICSKVTGKLVLDVGCGQGLVSVLLATKANSVIGIDINPKAIEESSEYLKAQTDLIRGKVTFLHTDFLGFNASVYKFDAILMTGILEHLVEPEQFIARAAEILTSDGKLIFTVPFGVNDNPYHKSPFYLYSILKFVSRYFEPGDITVIGKLIGFVLIKRSQTLTNDVFDGWLWKVCSQLEAEFYKIEMKYFEQIKLEKAKADKLKDECEKIKLEKALEKANTDELKDKCVRLDANYQGMIAREKKYLEQIKLEKANTDELKDKCARLDANYQETIVREKKYLEQIESEKANTDELNGRNEKLNINYQGLVAREKKYLEQIEVTKLKVNELNGKYKKVHANFIGMIEREKRYKIQIKELEKELVLARRNVLQKTLSSVKDMFYKAKHEPRLDHGQINSQENLEIITKQPEKVATLNINQSKIKQDLKIAAIMDEFTFSSYSPEAEVLQLLPENIEQQLSDFKPDMLFIESAWQGSKELWRTKVSNNAEELVNVIKWCKENQVPTMFWNKEDPVHFSTFLPVASQVDYVFTTDIDCIPKYKQSVGHDRVYLLPFAAQPKFHNPIEVYERKDAFNFAGSYYLKYPQRQRDFAALIEAVGQYKPFDIYDRNFHNPHPHYIFPDQYKSSIIGSLSFNEIDKAYKGYRYGINMNTIKQSQSMFARRIFELLASNTIVVSNFSRGVKTFFGDLVISSDDRQQLSQALDKICHDDVVYRKFRLLGLRKVMCEHTYENRLDYIKAKLSNGIYETKQISITIISIINNENELNWILQQYRQQNYKCKNLILLMNCSFDWKENDLDILFCTNQNDFTHNIKQLPLNNLIGLFSSKDYYGPNYLVDLALVPLYSKVKAFGKVCFYQFTVDKVELLNFNQQYYFHNTLKLRSGLIYLSELSEELLISCIYDSETATLTSNGNVLAIDEFSYCCDGVNQNIEHVVDDLSILNTGVSLSTGLFRLAEELTAAIPTENNDDNLPKISAEELYRLMVKPTSNKIKFSLSASQFIIDFKLEEKKHSYMYLNKVFTRKELNFELNSRYKLDCAVTGNVVAVFEFQDEAGNKLAHSMPHANGEHHLAIPNECKFIRFGLKVTGKGVIRISNIILGSNNQKPAVIASELPFLVLTKQYPAYDDLYRYGFLHSRVRAYKKIGVEVEVFRISQDLGDPFREFEGINIASGDITLFSETLKLGKYKNILVHLLDQNMWSVLKQHINSLNVTIWIHGAEIQIWQRREFEFELMSKEEIIKQKKLSDKRVKLWREVFSNTTNNLHYVFVSQYFADEVMHDLGVKLDRSQYSIIHNYIDNEIFPFKNKDVEQRKKILSIRPYASRKYANDLTVAAILKLSERDFFADLEFMLVGDGELFDVTVEPIKKFSNVHLVKSFMTHEQIARLHQEYGIFITPTRMDAQGVSRDEAMSSGMVPITTDTAAIPEFVDSNCGILTPEEDVSAIADAVEYLYNSPDSFLQLSAAAAARVRVQSGAAQTILQEINLIQKGNSR